MPKNKGVLYAAGAYLCWGLLPIYWKALQHVGPLELLAHRVVWALALLVVLLAARGRLRGLFQAMRDRRTMLVFSASAILLATNWLVYIWGVQNGHVVETSLGYFINPLVNVLFGVLFLHERLRIGQIAAFGLATAGVFYLTYVYGSLPWIALVLAGSFGVYGLLRKTATLGSLEGLTLETLVMLVPAAGYLIFLESQGTAAFGHSGLFTTVLLALAGVFTSVPLVLFAAGARRINLTTLGILQYIAPTLQFLLGVFAYGETLNQERLIGFALIWAALLIYTGESLWRGRAARAALAQQAG